MSEAEPGIPSKAKRGADARFTYLDGVRGLAALMVALSHFVIGFYTTLFSGSPAQSHFPEDVALSHTGVIFFFNPDLGVALFFVLSGFVLAASVAGHQPPWPALALRRWVRLCLPVLATTLLIWLALKAGAFTDVPMAAAVTKSSWLKAMYPPTSYLISAGWLIKSCLFTFFTGNTGPSALLNGVLWTMPVELLGSLGLFALYCLGADVFRRTRGCLGVSVVAVILTWHTPYYGFGCGVALFEIRRGLSYLPLPIRQVLKRAVLPLGVVALVLGVWLGGAPYAIAGFYLQLVTVLLKHGIGLSLPDMHHAGAALIIAAALLLRPLQGFLTMRFCQYLGRISFMLYLLQLPVLCSIGVFVFLHVGQGIGYNARALLTLAAYLTVTIVLADIATRLIDNPAIRLSRLATSKPMNFRGIGGVVQARKNRIAASVSRAGK